jgi:hypothetical protein
MYITRHLGVNSGGTIVSRYPDASWIRGGLAVQLGWLQNSVAGMIRRSVI